MKMNTKEVDSHKLMYHPKRVTEWLEKGDCAPVYIEVGVTNRCNHKCIFCALDWIEHGGKDIEKNALNSALEDMVKSGVKSVMFAGEGEPLLHKNISEFVENAKNYGLDVSITTNGTRLTHEKANLILPFLSWIRFSIDAGSKESYAKVHGTKEEDFERTLENLKYASKIKLQNRYKVTLGTQMLLIPETVNQIELLIEKVKNAGADNLQIKPYSHHPSSKNKFEVSPNVLDFLEDKIEKYNDDNFKVIYRKGSVDRIKSKGEYNECYGLPFFALIDAEGNIIPCNIYYGNKEFIYGNIYKNSFSEIWGSEKRKKVIEQIRTKGVERCREGCRLDSINRYLNRLKNPGGHDNFI